jgi:hypothetical protein
MAGWQENGMAGEAVAYDGRLRDLEAEAFRTGRTLAEHSEQLATIREQQRTAFGNIDSIGNAIGAPGESTIAERLETIEQRLGTIENVLSALARAQGINPETAG